MLLMLLRVFTGCQESKPHVCHVCTVGSHICALRVLKTWYVLHPVLFPCSCSFDLDKSHPWGLYEFSWLLQKHCRVKWGYHYRWTCFDILSSSVNPNPVCQTEVCFQAPASGPCWFWSGTLTAFSYSVALLTPPRKSCFHLNLHLFIGCRVAQWCSLTVQRSPFVTPL